MTTHVTGTAKIRGHSFEVDCVTLMDHSWGPRNERLMSPMGWINAVFGLDYSVQAIFSLDPWAKGWEAFKLAHGYALVDGTVCGFKSGMARAIRHGQFAVGYEMRFVDINDSEHALIGTTIAQHPWSCYSNIEAKLSTVEWHAVGRKGFGYGHAQENWQFDRLAGLDFRAGR
jgi:hypothetical protein